MPNIKYNMETVDEVIRDKALEFIDKARQQNKPFFVWLNPTRMHVVTHLSEKYEAMRTPENGWSIQEAGMAQLDDVVGSVMTYLKNNGLDDNTIVIFTTDNGAENFTCKHRSPVARAPDSKAASECQPSYAGPARFPPARSKIALSPGWTGSQLWWRLPGIRTS